MSLDLERLSVKSRIESAVFMDVYQRARERGTLADVAGLEKKFFATFGAKPEAEPLRTRLRDLLPPSVVSHIRAALGRGWASIAE